MADELSFEDTSDVPTGHRGSDIPESLLNALADSAKRNVGKVHKANEVGVKELRKMLSSSRVRELYDVTTGKHPEGLRFAAKHKIPPVTATGVETGKTGK